MKLFNVYSELPLEPFSEREHLSKRIQEYNVVGASLHLYKVVSVIFLYMLRYHIVDHFSLFLFTFSTGIEFLDSATNLIKVRTLWRLFLFSATSYFTLPAAQLTFNLLLVYKLVI